MKPLTEERYLSIVDIEEGNKIKFTEKELSSLNESFKKLLDNTKPQNRGNEFNCSFKQSNIEVLKFKGLVLVEIVASTKKGYYTFYYSFKNIKDIINNMSDLVSHIL